MVGSGARTEGWDEIASDARFWAFVVYFNRDRDYFECHEAMEELWLENGRGSLLQGMLQAAVGLHHWDNGNRSGAIKLMTAALDKLEAYERDTALGLDLIDLRQSLSRSLETLVRHPLDAPFQAFSLRIVDDTLRHNVDRWIESRKDNECQSAD